ncbi:MAG: pilus assembly protein [Anaerolineaceae bacterium]|nr:pilus assembly protein [Anaerolineaceae bacterium]
MTTLIKRLFRDRRAATAVALAIIAVPMLIAASAAVDFARIASARALLQASADAAAIAGAGAWQTSESSSYAASVTTAAYSGTGFNLSNFVSTSAPTPELTCTGTTTQCGGTASYATSTSTYGCPSSAEYCVVVQTSGVLKNSLFGFLLPSETLSVRSMATTAFPAQTITGKNIPPSPGFGSAGDVSGVYAYAVPMTGTGSTATPDYTKMPAANSSCSNYQKVGPLALLSSTTSDSSTACNYLYIALSTSSGTAGSGGSITLQQNQPIAFSFINYTGANNYHSGTYYQTNTQLYVSTDGSRGTYYSAGYPVPVYTTNTYTCSKTKSSCTPSTTGSPQSTSTASTGTIGQTGPTCTYGWNWSSYSYTYTCTTTVVTYSTTTLTGQCPNHTLYGSLDPLAVNTTSGANTAGVPAADSINTYSSAYEVIGYPPTYKTNRALIPFLATTLQQQQTVAGKAYYVTAICPNYATSGTDASGTTYTTAINAPISANYSNTTKWTGLNIFSTAFPGQTYSDSATNTAQDSSGLYTSGSIWMTNGTGDIYPPGIAACSPATNSSDNGVTTAPAPWWNWSSDNSGSCGNESSTHKSAYLSTGQPAYSNCTLIIQPLGTSVPVNSQNQALLPDYYLLVKNSSGTIIGLDPIWNGQIFTDLMPGVITSQISSIDSKITISGTTVTDKDTAATYNSSGKLSTAGFYPSSTKSYTINSGTYKGDTVTIEPPANSSEFSLPPETSGTCYNPQQNGNPTNTVVVQNGTSTPTQFLSAGDQNNGSAVDLVANPELGAILCTSNPPATYALYWNDLGTYGSDDIGYWNSIVAFTCSVPNSTNSGGGPATLSG